MRTSVRIWLACAFALGLAASVVRADAIDDVVREQMKARRIPGIAVAVFRDGRLVKSQGYGIADLESGTPVTPATVFEIGSISKQFASEAVMLLVEDGKIKLDEPINTYLGASAVPAWSRITVRDLLNHTSGIRDWTEIKDITYRREYTGDEFLGFLRDLPTLYGPRDSWTYSNTNPVIAGIIVEKVGGKPYEKFVEERILGKLGLASVRFRRQDEIVAGRANGYVLVDGELRNGEPFRPRVIAPSGGMLANVADLARWWDAALGGKIVTEKSLAEMLAPARLNDGRTVPHGFAFFTNTFNGHKFVFHNGSTVGGFGAGVYRYPAERVTIAVAGNLEDGGFAEEYIIKRIAGVYVPGSFIGGLPPKENAATPKMLALLRDIAGGRASAKLTESYAGRITPAFRQRVAADLAAMKSFKYLASEKIGPEHFVLDPNLAEMHYFRMETRGAPAFYHFRVTKDGRVGFIIAEN